VGETPTIGFLMSHIGNSYVLAVARGVADVARARGARMALLATAGIRSTPLGVPIGNIGYHFATNSVSGLVIASGMFTGYFHGERMHGFIGGCRHLPLALVAEPVLDVPTILVDNGAGIREAVFHLVNDHGRRRVGFLGDSALRPEMRVRFDAYRAAMLEVGLEPSRARIVDSALDGPGAQFRAVQILVEERKADFDALVCAGDDVAIQAIDDLRRHRMDVPGDVAVIGFDDENPMVTVLSPPLSTVHQPFYEQGAAAAESVFAQLAGAQVPERVTLPTRLVRRRSCGCFPGPATHAPSREGAWAGPLALALEATLAASESDEPFVSALDRALHGVADSDAPLAGWQDIVTVLRERAPKGDAAERILHQAREIVAQAAWHSEARQRIDYKRQWRSLGELNGALMGASDTDRVAEILGDYFPFASVRRAYMALLADRSRLDGDAQLLLRYEDGRASVPPEPVRFPARDILPPGAPWSTTPLCVQPLSFQGQDFGFFAYEGDVREDAFHEDLRVQLGSLVSRLETERQLEQAYRSLKENQEKLIRAEKMASLGRLTAGIAHEMNTPLAAVRAALSELAKLANELRESAGSSEVEPADYVAIADDLTASVRLGDKAAEQVAAFVRGIRFQTREAAKDGRQRFDVVTAVEEVLLLLEHVARKAQCTLSLEGPGCDVELDGDRARFGQVTTSLVLNAIEASEPKGGGPVLVALDARNGALELRVIDEGVGIAPADIGRIFDPMFTTKGFGNHTGLGLTITHDVITGAFGGTIDATSEVGRGSRLVVRVPLAVQTPASEGSGAA
jgi:DNA-binding LacI/PurR family transcriptional regulator/signal transduction histidine kinase